MDAHPYLSARDAALRLGVNIKTLYAYVSRGLVRSAAGDDPHKRIYRSEDVEALVEKKRLGRRASKIAESALNWGIPSLETEISTISNGRLLYRGRDATELARTATLEETAQLLWKCGDTNPFEAPSEFTDRPLRNSISNPIARSIALLNLVLPDARPIWGRSSPGIVVEAAQLTRLLVAGLLGRKPSNVPVHLQLARAWRLRGQAADLIRMALVLIADHELNASAFTVRVIASTGASLPACVTGGLAALSGPLHGGATLQVNAFLDRLPPARGMASFIQAMLTRGEKIPGFGHRLYPDGDPRAVALLAEMPKNDRREHLMRTVERVCALRPTIDFALLEMTRSLRLPPSAAISIFAAGRTAGWIAHALEQNEHGHLIRPRARYKSPSV
jgi:citrate synthase